MLAGQGGGGWTLEVHRPVRAVLHRLLGPQSKKVLAVPCRALAAPSYSVVGPMAVERQVCQQTDSPPPVP